MTRAEAEAERDRLTAAGVHAVVVEAGGLGQWDVVRVRVPGPLGRPGPLNESLEPPPPAPRPDPEGEHFRQLRYWGG